MSDAPPARSVHSRSVPAHVVPVLLTFCAGATDVTCFLHLGKVFASVMTGNMVLLGLAAGTSDAALAISAGLAFAGYAVGTFAGALIGGQDKDGQDKSGKDKGGKDKGGKDTARRGRSAAPVLTLSVQLAVLVGFTVLWVAAGGRPAGVEQQVLLVLAALAMGLQSAAVKQFGVPGLSTTYLTGTLTGLLFAVARTGQTARFDRWAAGRLVALVVGAGAAALVLAAAPAAVPALPAGALAVALAIAVGTRGRGLPGPGPR